MSKTKTNVDKASLLGIQFLSMHSWVGKVFVPLLISSTILVMATLEYQALKTEEDKQIHQYLSERAASMSHESVARMQDRIKSINRLASRMVDNHDIDEAVWEKDADRLIADYPELYALAWLLPDKTVIHSSGLSGITKQAAFKDVYQPVIYGPFLHNEKQVVQMIVPLLKSTSLVGYLVAQGYVSDLVNDITQKHRSNGLGSQVSVNGKFVCCEHNTALKGYAWAEEVVNKESGLELNIKVWPDDRLLNDLLSPLTKAPLVAGPIFALLLGLAFRWLVSSALKNKQITEVNKKLKNLSLAVNQSHSAILIADIAGEVVYVNQRFGVVTGFNTENVVGLNVREIGSNNVRCPLASRLIESIDNRTVAVWDGEVEGLDQYGNKFWDHATITPVTDNDIVTHYLAIRHDVTQRKKLEHELNLMAYYDGLTGLTNRAYLEENSERILGRARRVGRNVALMYMDLDHFKTINDSLGHDVGDMLLKEVSTRLRNSCRDDDILVRRGGDEFLIVLNDVHRADDVKKVATKILTALRQPFTITGRDLYIGASIGVSVFPDDGENMGDLLKHADTAMYQVKSSGRGQFCFYSSEMTSDADEYLLLEGDLRKALERKEFELHFQPQVNPRSGTVVSAEALLRWRRNGEYVSPVKFIPILEGNGLITSVGEWVLETAVEKLIEWEKRGLSSICLAVNISGMQLQDDGFASTVRSILKRHGYNKYKHCLELEVTETTLMEKLDSATTMLNTLSKEFDLKVAIDDFGTGYSSLSSLKSLPIDTLKIDKSFVDDVTTNPDDESIARAIIAMAHSLGLHVIAEGVENVEQQEFFKSFDDVDLQGYLFSRPLPEAEFELMLSNDKAQIRGLA